jgi:L-threonylcarbamoyladenylate synthase
MKTVIMSAGVEANIAHAAEILRQGGLVAFPTDTVYGLGACYSDEKAVLSIYIAKARPAEKAIPILLASVAEMDLVSLDPSDQARILAQRFWPGPLTIVVPKHPRVPRSVASETVGLRVPDNLVARGLIQRTGPLAVTSANLSGEDSLVSAELVLEQLDGRIDLILDGGPASGGVPSTVVDCTGDRLVILRPGPLAAPELQAALR